MKSLFLYFTLFFLVPATLFGQAELKKTVTPEDYKLWHTVALQSTSEHGNWVSYNVLYDGGIDTLFVKNKNATRTFAFPSSYDGIFTGDNWFICNAPDGGLAITNLLTESKTVKSDITQYSMAHRDKYLITTDSIGLTIATLDGGVRYSEQGVKNYSISPCKEKIIYNSQQGIRIVDLTEKEIKPTLISEIGEIFSKVAWQKSGKSFSIISASPLDNGVPRLYFYRYGNKNRINFDSNSLTSMKEVAGLESNPMKFKVSDDGTMVFFSTTPIATVPIDDEIRVWRGDDIVTVNRVQESGIPNLVQKVLVWWPQSNKILQLTSDEKPFMFLSGDQKYAITWNPLGSSSPEKYHPNTDYFITDLSKGTTHLFLQNQSTNQLEITASPQGKYIAYRRQRDWWIYDIAKNEHYNISKDIPISDPIQNYLTHGEIQISGWTTGEKGILLYNHYDTYNINLKNLNLKRLTNGESVGIAFRPNDPLRRSSMNFDGFIYNIEYDTNNLILAATGKTGKERGYYRYSDGVKKLFYGTNSKQQLVSATKSDVHYYIEQDYDSPPKIMGASVNSKTLTVYNSNKHHSKYFWGFSKLIRYTDSLSRPLIAALYLPANFDSKKRYPMIVYIYDKLSDEVHSYVNPSIHNNSGFNISNLTSQGYMVLCPDIEYVIGNVGVSAADCVIAATEAVIASENVDANNIALMGHSFGGYETGFIATQTNLFKTFISGMGFFDFVSNYLTMSRETSRPDSFRFEEQQMRMGKSFYDDKTAYLRNSPIMFADKISSPYLIFVGGKDENVDPRQSMEFYIALRRLKKKVIMLEYQNEHHIVTNPNLQADLTCRIEEWLDHYLKGEPSKEWFKNI